MERVDKLLIAALTAVVFQMNINNYWQLKQNNIDAKIRHDKTINRMLDGKEEGKIQYTYEVKKLDSC